jgi:hypothetical protein
MHVGPACPPGPMHAPNIQRCPHESNGGRVGPPSRPKVRSRGGNDGKSRHCSLKCPRAPRMQPRAAKMHQMTQQHIMHEMASVWMVGVVSVGPCGALVMCAARRAAPPMLHHMQACHACESRTASSGGARRWHSRKKWRIPRPDGAEMAAKAPVPFHTGGGGVPQRGEGGPKFDESGRVRCVMARGCAT